MVAARVHLLMELAMDVEDATGLNLNPNYQCNTAVKMDLVGTPAPSAPSRGDLA